VRDAREAAQPLRDRARRGRRPAAELGADAGALNVAIASSASGSAPSRPNSDGIHTVKPASRTQRAKRARCGLMPGISGITITAGPLPATWTIFERPSMSTGAA
jgi:hypothetical protein